MKNKLLKYAAAAAMSVLALASCEEMVDYVTTIDAPSKLAYMRPGGGDTYWTVVTHRPSGSLATDLYTEFQVQCNTTNHDDATVSVVMDESLVASYNEEHNTSYVPLPQGYLDIQNSTVSIPYGSKISADTVRISLSKTADLEALGEPAYLAPIKVEGSGLDASQLYGNLWVMVYTETNLYRSISSATDLVGYSAGGRETWTANCQDYANLFDGNANTGVSFGEWYYVDIDMKKELMVTGFKIGMSSAKPMKIEYSLDGEQWSAVGTPGSGEYVYKDRTLYSSIHNYITARYFRLTFNNGAGYISEFEPCIIESSDPTLYAQAGNNNIFNANLRHVTGVGSSSDLNAGFKVDTTISSETGYDVKVSVDNSLIAEYNKAHNTSYVQMPSANIDLQNGSMAIGPNEYSTSDYVRLSLTGDLSNLTEPNGYLIPLVMKASGAKTSESRGVVYAVISTETKLIKAITSPDQIAGFLPFDRSSWTADCQNPANLFDGDNNTAVNFNPADNVVKFDLGGKHFITGLKFSTYSMIRVTVDYSLDGTEWRSAGTAERGEFYFSQSSYDRVGDFYIAFGEYLEASYIRLTFAYEVTSVDFNKMHEFNIYEIDGADPAVYTVAGTDNTFYGELIQNKALGSSNLSLNAQFKVMATMPSTSGWNVKAEMDASLVIAYNTAHNTNYAALDPSYVSITGSPCPIAAGATVSEGSISVTLKGDLTGLEDLNGYLIPVRLSAGGATTSASHGIVYVVIRVKQVIEIIRKITSIDQIEGVQVADRSAWTIVESDDANLYTPDTKPYSSLFDGSRDTYVRTYGGPISFTVDMGKVYNMKGLVITARSSLYYQTLQPKSVSIEGSVDGVNYTDYGTVSNADGTLLKAIPSSYASFYGVNVRYLKIIADYGGANMGTAEFNIYAN